jgi:hypothetical protein
VAGPDTVPVPAASDLPDAGPLRSGQDQHPDRVGQLHRGAGRADHHDAHGADHVKLSSFFSTGISDTIPIRFSQQATMLTRHHYHHFPISLLDHLTHP